MARTSRSSNHGKRSLSLSRPSPSPKTRTKSQRSRPNMPSQVAEEVQRPSTPSLGAAREDVCEDEQSQEYLNAQSQLVEQQQIEKDYQYAIHLAREEECTLGNEDEPHFPLMDLPPELRLNIFRCCLTRPYNILLSKLPPLPRECSSLGEEDISRLPLTVDRTAPPSTIWGVMDGQSQRGIGLVRRSLRNLASRRSRSTRPSTSRTTNAVAPNAIASTGWRWSRDEYIRADLARLADLEKQRHRSATGEPEHRPQNEDRLIVEILRTTKQIYKEARSILYNENLFKLDLDTAQMTLSCLHQRSRMQIRHLEITIPTQSDIIDRFAEVVRLSLRYCWGLKKLVINMPFELPGVDDNALQNHNATVFANAFDILRWLPQACEVELTGNPCKEIARVVERNARLSQSLSKTEYARRQLISAEGALPNPVL